MRRSIVPTSDMQAGKHSRTAEAMAIIRAMEYRGQEPARRILTDPWAEHFIQSHFARRLVTQRLSARLMSLLTGLWIPGAQEYALARARLVDDLTLQLATQGLRQLVILGAGFDTTIFRLQDKLCGVRVFEVDHPATQRVKMAALSRIDTPENLHFVPVDFESENIAEQLMMSGFQRKRFSLFTWMGVTYYLTNEAVAETVTQLAGLCAPGSHFILDFASEAVVAGATGGRAARIGLKQARWLGEPFLFGRDSAQAISDLADFGFDLITLYDQRKLQELYCPRGRAPVDFMYIVWCVRRD